MKALIRSPLVRHLAHPPRILAPNRLVERSGPHMEIRGHLHGASPEPKWKRVLVRLGHQGIHAAEASVVAAGIGYAYGRSGPDSALTKVPLDLVFGAAMEFAAAMTENAVAASHLEAAALGAIALHAGAWGRARGQGDRQAAEAARAHEDAKALPGKSSSSGMLGEVGERSPERGVASMSEEELARLITRT
jgi:hypothetical protein